MRANEVTVSFDEGAVDRIFRELDQTRLPGAAVGIAIKGRPVYRKGFGLASMELPVALSSATRMRMGSITKHFTSLAYLLLCEQGLATLDDPIRKYLPRLNPVCHGVTVRQLMGHVSGLRDVCDIRMRLSGYGGTPTTRPELLQLYSEIDDANASPGTTWIYNNGAYVVLSEIVQEISGRSLEEALRHLIFDPVGMYDTFLRPFDTNFVPHSARPHAATMGGAYETSYWGLDFAGAGSMVSTVDDMLRWLAHMDTPVVGTADTWKLMRAPLTLSGGASTGYGLGLAVSSYRGVETVSHIGGWTGANAQMVKVPRAGIDVVVMVNRGDVFAPCFVNAILDACLTDLEPGQPYDLRPITGNYLAKTTGRVVQFVERRGEQIVSIDGHDVPYVPQDEGTLRPAPIWRHIKRTVKLSDYPRQPTPIQIEDFGSVEDLVPLVAADNPPVAGICGRYRSKGTGTEVVIYETAGEPFISMHGRFGSTCYRIQSLADDIWRATSPVPALLSAFLGGVLVFDRDKAAFRLSTYGNRSLRFKRAG